MNTNNDALREALELGLDYAREALALHDQKYQRHPSTEAERALIAGHVEQIEQTLAASKPEQAQGEPEVVATVSSRWNNGRGFDVDDFGKNLPNYGDELITLQSHREAIAQHRAALEECVGLAANFEVSGPDADGLVWLVLHGNGTTGKAMFNLGSIDRIAAQTAMQLEQDRRAAITHANQVLGRKEFEV